MAAMTVDQVVDSMAVRLRAEDVGGLTAAVNLTVTDLDEQWVLRLSNRTLHARPGHDAAAPLTVHLDRATLLGLADGTQTVRGAIDAGDVDADGPLDGADAVFGHLDTFLTNFAIVEP